MKKNVFARFSLLSISSPLFAVLCVTALIMPSTAYADEDTDQDALYEPKVVSIVDDPAIEDPWENVTYEKTSGDYEVLLCGVSEANQEVLADAIFANLKSDEPVKFTNQGFIDAEKYSVAYEDFDKYHCWLCSTSNILTLTGWAQNYFNPLEGSNFNNEDEVLALLTSSFQDQSCDPCLAYAYFFDGLFGGTHHDWIRLSEPTSNKPFMSTTFEGFDPKVGYANLVNRVECGTTLLNLSVLEDLQECALEMSIGGATSHSVTITGVVIDTSKTGAESYVAILIADSDNDASQIDGAPATMEDSLSVKTSAANSYTMYHLSIGEVNGETVALIDDYMKYHDDTYISSFTQVKYFDSFTRDTAVETAENATCNSKTTGDIALSSIEVFDENYDTKTTYTTTDKLQLMSVITSMNVDVAFDTATTKVQTLENRIDVYRDGTQVGTITDGANVSLADGIDGTSGTRLFVDLSSYDFMKTPGTYTVEFYLNTGNIEEAYVSNDNSPQSCTFTIVEDAGDDDIDTDASAYPDTDDDAIDEDISTEDNDAQSVSETNEDAKDNSDENDGGNVNPTSTATSSSLADTGDTTAPLVGLAALAVVLSGLLALVAARRFR